MTFLLILPAAACLTVFGPRLFQRRTPSPVRAKETVTALSHHSLKR